jgi:hypothetical protein
MPSAPRIAIATMTLARDPREAELLRSALTALSRLGLRIFVADAGSPPELIDFIDQSPGMTRLLPVQPGLVGQVRASLRAARDDGADYVLYTEPDKRWFFETRLDGFLGRAIATDLAVVIAARSAESFTTFPPMQRLTEESGNRLCAACTGIEGDYGYGPFLFRSDLVQQLDAVTPSLGWGWRPFFFTRAHRLGCSLGHLVDDLPCPMEERDEAESDRVHRLRQLAQNVDGIAAGIQDAT